MNFRTRALLLIVVTLLSAAVSHEAQAEKSSIHSQYAVGPDANFELLKNTLKAAKKEILINIYEFDNDAIAELVAQKIRANVTVKILLETQPCCQRKMSNGAKKVLRFLHSEIQKSSNTKNVLYLMGNQAEQTKRRFNFNHAKYLVLDQKMVLVSSENFTGKGHSLPGVNGNRGWDVVVDHSTLVSEMNQIFYNDVSTDFGDVLKIKAKDKLPSWAFMDEETDPKTPAKPDPRPDSFDIGNGKVDSVEIMTSPDSLAELKGLIADAEQSLQLQFMTLPQVWKSGPKSSINPLITELVKMAKTGVDVRVLLNDERAFGGGDPAEPKANEITVAYLSKLASCYNLNLDAKVIDTKATNISYIHNKGIIVDDYKTLVSSINGTMNAVMNNREMALQIEGTAPALYFKDVFNSDWDKTSEEFNEARIANAKKLFQNCPTLPGQSSHDFTPNIPILNALHF